MSRASDDASNAADARISEMFLWFELYRLQEHYIGVIDSNRLEEWPALFTDDGLYEIVPKENLDQGLSIGIMHCFGQRMMRDRVVSLRQANVYEPHTYRHLTSGLEFSVIDDTTYAMESNYIIVQTLTDGESRIYQAGRYFDRVIRTAAGWRYQSKRAVYDTSRVATLLVTPV